MKIVLPIIAAAFLISACSINGDSGFGIDQNEDKNEQTTQGSGPDDSNRGDVNNAAGFVVPVGYILVPVVE